MGLNDKQVKASLARASEDYLKLLAYVQDRKDGELVEYSVVVESTGVPMDYPGKNKLRRAILRSQREYTVIPNVGYMLANPDIAMNILSQRLIGIDNKVRRAEKTQQVLQQSFYNSLSQEEQKGILFLGAVFGAIRQAADKGKELYKVEPKKLTEGQPILPSNV